MGSLNISGDPTLSVTTPGVTVAPFQFEPPVGTAFNVLSDPDHNFSMKVTLHEVNDNRNTGIQVADFSINGRQVQFANDGSLIVDGVNKGKLSDAGFISAIDLGNGASVKTAMMDDGGGNQVERLVLVTPEYEITAARRQPNNTKAYFDINLAERVANAADNSTGDDVPGQGSTGVDDMLRKEP